MAHAGLVLFALAAASCGAQATCWSEAQSRYDVPAPLLYGIACAESDLRPLAMNRSHLAITGSYDIGLMQINSGHLPALAQHGISEPDLLEACTSVMVGAWILRQLFERFGPTWEAVGAYNAACTRLKGPECQAARAKYAWRVYRCMRRGFAPEPVHATPVEAMQSPRSAPILSARASP